MSRSVHHIMSDLYTGAGDAEDRRWATWCERVSAHLDRLGWGSCQYAGRRDVHRATWELYCDGAAPLAAARKLRRVTP
jgi:hypothetical protein